MAARDLGGLPAGRAAERRFCVALRGHDARLARSSAPGARNRGPLLALGLAMAPAKQVTVEGNTGVADVAWTGHDTRTDATRFYSNRRAYLEGEQDFGRLMSAISLG